MADIRNQPVPTRQGQQAPVPNGVRPHDGSAVEMDITTNEAGTELRLGAPRRMR